MECIRIAFVYNLVKRGHKMSKNFIIVTFYVGILTGCAGSATHQVVSAYQASDDVLSCSDIDSEIIKTQAVIDAINKDKEDISGADVVDTVLWFPFNLLAKSQNYQESLNAADRRIARLHELRKERGCYSTLGSKQKHTTSLLSQELNELNKLYKSGALTKEEYKVAKQKVLNDNTFYYYPTQPKVVDIEPKGDNRYPYKLTGSEIKKHFHRYKNFTFDKAPKSDFTIKIRSFNDIDRICDMCRITIGSGSMNIKETQNQVCFYWDDVSYPSSSCFEVVKIEDNRYQLIDPVDGETYGYKVAY